jgi:hypothetical protein
MKEINWLSGSPMNRTLSLSDQSTLSIPAMLWFRETDFSDAGRDDRREPIADMCGRFTVTFGFRASVEGWVASTWSFSRVTICRHIIRKATDFI